MIIRLLVAGLSTPHKRAVADLFDIKLRAQRRDRAARKGPVTFLFERAFDDCLERLDLLSARFERCLLIGCPDPRWPVRLSEIARVVDVVDPGALFAEQAGGVQLVEDEALPPGEFDLVIAVGTLDSVNDLPRALRLLHEVIRPGGFLIGAMSGGDALPRLREAMIAGDRVAGIASPHVHPRIEASALGALLTSARFSEPVVDVDRVRVTYSALARLVDDLRGMGATNIMTARPRAPISKESRLAAEQSFARAGDGQRTEETFEILHFAAWRTQP